MKKALLVLPFGLGLLVLVILIRTFTTGSPQLTGGPQADIPVDTEAAVARLSEAIRFQTISYHDPTLIDVETFSGFLTYLETSFPKVHVTLVKEIAAEHSLLYTLQGTSPGLKPVLLIGHLDVVPVESESSHQWVYPAFSGEVADGYIWGRGTLDDKSSVLGILEALEMLMSGGFQPERTIYLAFGHDEEVLGSGAASIASLLKSRGVELEYVLDEGFFVTDGIVPYVDKPVALIGIAHKGYATIELSAEAQAGHSSMPPAHTAIGALSRAISRLESSPMKARLDGPALEMLKVLSPEMPFGMRAVFSNLWLFGPIVEKQMSASATTNASIRTTTAVTMFSGGVQENVLPYRAAATVNFRLIPGDSSQDLLEHVRQTIDDPQVGIHLRNDTLAEPSRVASTGSFGYTTIAKSIRSVFPEALVAPGLVIGMVDARQYRELTEDIYMFLPIWMESEDLDRMHGSNERLAIDDYRRMIAFYTVLLQNSAR